MEHPTIQNVMGLAGGFSCNRAEAEKPWKGNAREAESVRLGYPCILRRWRNWTKICVSWKRPMLETEAWDHIGKGEGDFLPLAGKHLDSLNLLIDWLIHTVAYIFLDHQPGTEIQPAMISVLLPLIPWKFLQGIGRSKRHPLSGGRSSFRVIDSYCYRSIQSCRTSPRFRSDWYSLAL